ncbi:hypothetical protein, partial [Gordonia sp. UBA7860]|uniref:hypothetical protein n=1 Tax=Gordonia sp. UBA7860 TaxID=1946579 RepID=UPI002579D2A9
PTSPPLRPTDRPENRVAPMPRLAHPNSGFLHRHPGIHQPRQLVTEPNTVLLKRHDRRNLSPESVATIM